MRNSDNISQANILKVNNGKGLQLGDHNQQTNIFFGDYPEEEKIAEELDRNPPYLGLASFIVIISILTLIVIIPTGFYLWLPDVWPSVRTQVKVKAKSDPWLAGMPDKSLASVCKKQFDSKTLSSVAPQNSPTEVQEIPLISGSYLLFTVDGKTRRSDNNIDFLEPDGDTDDVVPHEKEAENGISNIYAPMSSLVGVFLGAEQPNKDSSPSELSFNSPTKLNYFTISPQLNQVFFIGDGRTNMGIKQRVIVPPEAKRFYLGIFDACGWEDNQGVLDVKVTAMPSTARQK